MSVRTTQLYYKKKKAKNRVFDSYNLEVSWLHERLIIWAKEKSGKKVLQWHRFRQLLGTGALRIKKNKWRQVLEDLENLDVLKKSRKFAIILPLREVKNGNFS